MDEIERLQNNEYEGANAETLKALDATTIENRLVELNDRIEEVEYLIYNAEEVIDNTITSLVLKAENELNKEVWEEDTITDIMDSLREDLKDKLAKRFMDELSQL